METYYLGTLLEDKALCKDLIAKGIVLCDKSGSIGDIDFANNSMRYNHISTFEKLYAYGGKKLFDAILKSGKTCLCTSPDAAKVGVVEIEGADGFYLKSNVSAIVAFMSILNGIHCIHLITSEVDPCTDFYVDFSDEAEESATEDWGSFEEISLEEEPEFYENALMVQKTDEGYVLCDKDTGEPVTFTCNDGTEMREISVMYSIEPLEYTKDFGTDELLFEDADGEKRTAGYRYQLEKDGKWGFISEHFAHFVYPIYVDILITKQGAVIGYYMESNLNITVSVAHSREYTSLDNFSLYDKVLHGPEYKYAVSDNPRELYMLRNVHPAYLPKKGVLISSIEEDLTTIGVAYAFDQFSSNMSNRGIYKCKDKTNSSFPYGTQFYTKYQKGFITLEGENFWGHTWIRKVPAAGSDAAYCKAAYEWEPVDGIEYVGILDSYLYIAKKEGYYGLVIYNTSEHKLKEYETPFAFTNIQKISDDCCLVERFGKKGVYNYKTHTYLVPCEYEKVEMDAGHFVVYKGGFKGEIGLGGEWAVRLHREA